jgi:Big-like domain-containing protein
MRTRVRYGLVALLSALSLTPLLAAADAAVLFDLKDPNKTVFPSNLFTKVDVTQSTLRRVSLPKSASCSATPVPVSCTDIDVLNELDGFNPQPRVSIPFSGPIDVSTVTSDTLFLLSLGSTTGGGSFGQKVGINQIVWDPASNTLHVESDQFLDQHTRYAVIVTNGIHDADGNPIQGGAFDTFRHDLNFGQTKNADLKEYRKDLIDAFDLGGDAAGNRVVAASVFSTLSTTATMEKVRRQVHGVTPAPATFNIGNGGTARAVFSVGAITSVISQRQVGITGGAPRLGTATPLSLAGLQIFPGTVGTLAFGKFSSPNYLAPGEFIPNVGTATGVPAVQSMNDIYFDLFVPAGPKPAGGWPIAIFGHGFGSNKEAAPIVLAASLARQGIALVSINVVGHGQGPAGTFTVNTASGAVVIPNGGRGIDQNGDGNIDTTEGSNAAAPRSLLGSTDALRQTAVDLMQLTRVIETGGIDVDGDGSGDFNPARIYYFGQSFGGIYGTMFLAIEPDVRVGVPNVAGGPTIEIVRLSPVFRPLFVGAAAARGLTNAPSPGLINENFPLRDEPPRINNVTGAMDIQRFMDNSEWAGHVGNPVSYAPHLRKNPLDGVPAKTLIFQNAKGDQTVPNPTNTAIIRAGDLADRWTFYRNDLAFAANPATPKNPHTFLTNVASGGLAPTIALEAQAQIATFFASDGATMIDPDGAGVFFEVPIVPPLPEVTNFIP